MQLCEVRERRYSERASSFWIEIGVQSASKMGWESVSFCVNGLGTDLPIGIWACEIVYGILWRDKEGVNRTSNECPMICWSTGTVSFFIS